MRVLVVGGTGFIGGHAARAFREAGHAVTALVRDLDRAAEDPRLRGATLVRGDVCAIPELSPHEAIVYAVGAWLPDDPAPASVIERRCREVYIDGVTRLAALAQAWRAHFLFLSGTSRYGVTSTSRLTEETPPGVLTIFGAHKRRAESILAATDGVRWTALVPPEVYGAHDPGGYVHFVYRRVRARRFVLLGRGENRWSLCHVDNVTDALVALAPGPGRGVIHVADASATSQRSLATAVARSLGRAPVFLRVPRALALAAATAGSLVPREGPRLTPGHVRARTRDILVDTRTIRSLGITPRASLASGVAAAVAWWEQRGRW